MSFTTGLIYALVRAALIGVGAVAMGRCITRLLRPPVAESGPSRFIPFFLAAIFFMPTVIVGYAYSDGPWSLVRHPWLNDLLYSTLLLLKLLPIAVAALYFAPPPSIDAAACHLRRLAPPSSTMAAQRIRQAWRFFLHGPLRAITLAFVAVFLLAFTDFELASLLNSLAGREHSAFTWTIALHQAQQLNVQSTTLVAWAASAAAIEAIVIIIGLTMLLRARRGRIGQHHPQTSAGKRPRVIGWITLAFAAIAILLLPGWIILRGSVEGVASLLANFRFADELASSLYFACGATALVVAALMFLPRSLRWVIALPGLLGGIVLSMLILLAFQWPVLRELYHTPVPLVLGLTLLLLPVAVVLRGLFDAAEPGTSVHAARMLYERGDAAQHRAGRSLLWHLRGRPWLALAAIVFTLAYFELVVSVTLAPVGMSPAIVELYNQMHFGQRAVLSATVMLTMAVPVVIVVAMWGFLRVGLAEPRPDR
ncbi:MAG: hypothetical protein WD768_14440 [Phycisphaeraceae bacterium]